MSSYMKNSYEFIVYINSYMNSYIWISRHMNSHNHYMNMKWIHEFMSIWIHVYEFKCVDSDFINEFISILILISEFIVFHLNSWIWFHYYEFTIWTHYWKLMPASVSEHPTRRWSCLGQGCSQQCQTRLAARPATKKTQRQSPHLALRLSAMEATRWYRLGFQVEDDSGSHDQRGAEQIVLIAR